MRFESRNSLDSLELDLIAVGVPEGSTACDARFMNIAESLYKSGDLPLKPSETCIVPGSPKTVFVGISKAGDAETWRRAAATVVRCARKARKIAFAGGDPRAIAEGAVVGAFSVEQYKSNGNKASVEEVYVLGSEPASLEQGRLLAESINWARQLINEPSNNKPPRVIADRAVEMAKSVGLEIDVLDETRIRELKMGALLGVSQGSDEPPRLLVLKHNGKPGSKTLLTFVGKGVTFDTGGISLKPADGMEKMKYDMAGGATAMAALRTLALFRAPVNCMVVVPLVENMPGGRAQRPGDVVRAMSGKTIEIINTDAEGRLILADALAYAIQLGATHLVDLATLTGAVRVALGAIRVGVLGNQQPFIDRLLKAADRCGERMWQLPMDDDYREMIKSSVADVANSGGRFAGTITAAKFLEEFVGNLPWVHLDIAGTAWNDEEKPYLPKGPSGVAVRTLVELALGFSEE
jgi:leucyl aminopeptidase